jgi:hypothetical protein
MVANPNFFMGVVFFLCSGGARAVASLSRFGRCADRSGGVQFWYVATNAQLRALIPVAEIECRLAGIVSARGENQRFERQLVVRLTPIGGRISQRCELSHAGPGQPWQGQVLSE